MSKKYTKAYTLTEIVVVVLIISIFATIALPSFGLFIERMKAQEMIHQLLAVYTAQKECMQDTGCYAAQFAFGGPCDNTAFIGGAANLRLSKYVDLPASSNFDEILVACGDTGGSIGQCYIVGDGNCDNSPPQNMSACNGGSGDTPGYIASVERWDYSLGALHPQYPYTLSLLEDGRVVCTTDGGNECLGLCKKLGFEPY